MSKLVYDRTGIHLPESKLSLLSNRLRRRLRELGLDSFRAYYELLCDAGRCDDELPCFLSAVTTNETYFFRNKGLWTFFRTTWIPGIVQRKNEGNSRSIRIWSAACSTGEEAYTSAICLLEELPHFETWQIRILGTDISRRVLDGARTAEYPEYAVSRTSKTTIRRWFERDGAMYVLKPEVRKIVRFQFHNLRDPFTDEKFDLILLRNVLMYFDEVMKLRVLANVADALAPGGHLFVGDVDPIRSTPALSEAVALERCDLNLYRKPERRVEKAGS